MIIIAVVAVLFIIGIASQGGAASKEQLQETIDSAETVYDAGQSDYTNESWAAFSNAYDNAQVFLDDGNASQQEVDDATAELEEAMGNLEIKPVDKSALSSNVNTYLGYVESDYTPETWQSFSSALQAAQDTLGNESATQSEVDDALDNLTAAALALEEAFDPADYASVAFRDLARNPDSHAGQNIVVSGRVVQVLEGSSETNLRIATDGGYDDIVFVGFDPSIIDYHILEDDNVTVYGTCIGQFSYESTLGATISLPGIYAVHVELNS